MIQSKPELPRLERCSWEGGCGAAFLHHLAARAYSTGTIEAHQWALKGFLEWADSQNLTSPGTFTRVTIEAYQLHLHHYRSPRTKEPLGVNTQLGRLGCVRRFFAWLCRSGTLPANPAADLDLPRKQSRRLPDEEPPDLWDQTAGFSNDWNQSRPAPKLSEVALGNGRILVPCFD